MIKVAYIYVRVSTKDQAHEGVSLEAQKAKALAWCELNDYEVGGVFVDEGISGKCMENRLGLQQVLSALKRGDTLIIYSLSRLARSTKDTLILAEQIQKQGCDLISLSERIDTTTATGSLSFKLLAVLAEFERDQISERTRFALQHKKAKGECVGQVPYGKVRQAHLLVDDPKEQEIIAVIKKLRAENYSYGKIGKLLTEQGYKPRGKKWYSGTVYNIYQANLDIGEGNTLN